MSAKLREATGRAYCSSANLGAGFDVFGLALDKYSDTVRMRFTQSRKINIVCIGPQRHGIPNDFSRNSAGPPAKALLREARERRGLKIGITKNVPQGLGLGSSGATAAACVKTLSHLLDLKLSKDELVQIASLGEKAVAGTAHADNVAASLLGGFVLVYNKPLRAVSMKPPAELGIVLATPQIQTQRNKTRSARSLVPRRIETKKAVLNIGRASAIATGFATGNIEMIGTGMQDEIAEPYRQSSIPGYNDARRLALQAGAEGVSLSGAGPSLIALLDSSKHDPTRVGRAMIAGFGLNKIRSTWFTSHPAPAAKVIRER